MNTSLESLAWWKVHMAAQRKAEAAGACWQCAIEAGCRATDGPGERRGVEMHVACERKIQGLTGPRAVM
jgi:hypothetical protein